MDSGSSNDTIIQHIRNDFCVVKESWLRILIDWVPPVIICLIILDWLITIPVNDEFFTSDPMGCSGWLTVAIAIIAIKILFDTIPETLETLWMRGVLDFPEKRKKRQFKTEVIKKIYIRTIERINLLHSSETVNKTRSSGSLEERYIAYVDEYYHRLNSPWGYIFGFIFALLGVGADIYNPGGFHWALIYNPYTYGYFYSANLCLAAPFIAGFILGLLAWRIIVISWQTRNFGKVFGLKVQALHRDRSGGLSPLGKLVTQIALVIAIPAIFLSGWIILIEAPTDYQNGILKEITERGDLRWQLYDIVSNQEAYQRCFSQNTGLYGFLQRTDCDNIYQSGINISSFKSKKIVEFEGVVLDIYKIRYYGYRDYFKFLLMILVILAFIAFFLPLYSIHCDMIYYSSPIRRNLDKIGRKMDTISCTLLSDLLLSQNGISSPWHLNNNPEKQPGISANQDTEIKSVLPAAKKSTIEESVKELKLLQDYYDQNVPVPVWPFNKQVALKFIIPQVIPLLTVTGIAPALLNILSSVMGALPT